MKTRSVYHLPLSSLQWLLCGLFLAALPLWPQLPAPVLIGFLSCLGWRFFLERKGLKCPRVWVRLVVGIGGLLVILGLHGTLLGLNAGMSLLLLLLALKVLEMRTGREFLLLSFLGFFIVLTALFFIQTLGVCLYVATVFLVLTATVVHFNSGATEGFRFWPLLRYAMVLIFQAAPLVLVLFFLLPRFKGGFMLQLHKSNLAQTGMSDQINPGSFAALAQSDEVAFRVDFPEGHMPQPLSMYWRVAVMSECHGLAWRQSDKSQWDLAKPQISGERVVQRVSMEPHEGRWVYALDRPVSADGPTYLDGGNCIALKGDDASGGATIRVVSFVGGNDLTPLTLKNRILATALPEKVSARTQQLVDYWRSQTAEPRQIVQLALQYFHQQRFRYTLTPGSYSNDGLDEFLFERRLGFCEHYAAAFASLMRVAGIPSRMVAGYQGGEFNPFGSHLIIRQSDAHAWAEVWLRGEGWVRIDPAAAVDPSRVDPNTQLAEQQAAAMQTGEASSGRQHGSDLVSQMLGTMNLAWDSVNYEWNLWVLGYDRDMQRDFYLQLGIHQLFSWRLFALLLGGILLAVTLVWFGVRQRGARKDSLLLLYRRHCEIFARAGMPRRPNEGPQNYALRLCARFPDLALSILESFDGFTEARYHSKTVPETERKLHGQLREMRRLVASAKD